jgi:hypothetical protein
VKPKLISDNEVRITDISVRSALMRVRWNDIPVRRDPSSTDGSSNGLAAELGGRGKFGSSGAMRRAHQRA